MTTAPECPALVELAAVVARAMADGTESQRKRAHWIEQELVRAVERGVMPEGACAGLDRLLSPAGVRAYLEAGRRGMLRRSAGRGSSSAATMRTRRIVLSMFGVWAGVRVVLPPPTGEAEVPDEMTEFQWRVLWRTAAAWSALAPTAVSREMRVRTCAAVGVVRDARLSMAELVAMRVGDLVDGGAAVVVDGQRHALTEQTRNALSRWLEERAALVARLQGSEPTRLWLRTQHGAAGPAGLPLLEETLRVAYRELVAEANASMAGVEGWEPISSLTERLRRSRPLDNTNGGEALAGASRRAEPASWAA
ncbi:hypothetical protein [Kitasatospora cineracea]|uniref:Uncharacterized protein n=1 Tax=Kitasatospora cineracea TaxID=88074 RepID=A0A3N4RRC4_9ACTN|nr:hypothetical protein [Kitasatospora cineracea]RPE26624.1 hypothetical protein EDD38_7686 [Kitasatospora cineracea]